jgi:hypothetical protein
VSYTAPTDTGGDTIDKYIIEYHSNTSADSWTAFQPNITFEIQNTVGNDSNGYFRLSFSEDYQTTLLPWAATASQVQSAINSLSTLENVAVERFTLSGLGTATWGLGYKYVVTLSEEVGPLAFGNFTVDTSQLSSMSLTHNYQVLYTERDMPYTPLDFNTETIYADCGKMGISSGSRHQIITVFTDTVDIISTGVNNENIPDYGDGSFRITLGDFVSPCIPFAVKVEDLKTMLEDASHNKLLENVISACRGEYPLGVRYCLYFGCVQRIARVL